MKVVLVLCLLAFMSCQKDIIDIAKCLYESPKVQELIGDVITAIVTQDFSKLWPKIKEALPDLIPVVIKCLTENDVNLQIIDPIVYNIHEIKRRNKPQNKPPETYDDCIKICDEQYNHENNQCYEDCKKWFGMK